MNRKLASGWEKIRALDEELATVNISLNFKGLASAPVISKAGLGAQKAAEVGKTSKRKEKTRFDILERNDTAGIEDAHGPFLWRQVRAQVRTRRKS